MQIKLDSLQFTFKEMSPSKKTGKRYHCQETWIVASIGHNNRGRNIQGKEKNHHLDGFTGETQFCIFVISSNSTHLLVLWLVLVISPCARLGASFQIFFHPCWEEQTKKKATLPSDIDRHRNREVAILCCHTARSSSCVFLAN